MLAANKLVKSVAKASSRNSVNEETRITLKTNSTLNNAESKSSPEIDKKNEEYSDSDRAKSRDKSMFYINLSVFFRKKKLHCNS